MYKEYYKLLVKGYGRFKLSVVICIVSIITSFIEGFNVGLLIPLLDALDSGGSGSSHWISQNLARVFEFFNIPFELVGILLVLGSMVILGAAFKYLRLALVCQLRMEAVVWMRSRYMWSVINTDMSYYHANRLGVMTDRVTHQCSRAGDSIGEVAEALFCLSMILAYVIAAFLIAPLLAIGALAIFLIVAIAMHYFVRKADRIGARLLIGDNNLQVSAIESLSGIQVVKSFLLEKARWSDFESRAREVKQGQYILAMNASLMTVLQEIVVFAIIGSIVFVSFSLIGLTIPVILALLFSLYRLMPRFAQLNSIRQSLAGSMAAVRTIGRGIESLDAKVVINGDRHFSGLNDRIAFNSVRFSYDANDEVLKGTHFTAEKGQMTAIVGASGAGKSTLISLLQRFYDPEEGALEIDGVNLKEFDLQSWRASLGIVSQDVFLFNDTVFNNIAVSNSGTNKDQVYKAAKGAYCHEFIKELPNGYDTIIGDRGWNLSGGQRQRIALARAILHSPEILILDEATSSLDSESEQLIQKYMNDIRTKSTMIVVAHRTATIRNADKIVVLQNGKIVEEGTWDSLSKGEGIFATYQNLQTSS